MFAVMTITNNPKQRKNAMSGRSFAIAILQPSENFHQPVDQSKMLFWKKTMRRGIFLLLALNENGI